MRRAVLSVSPCAAWEVCGQDENVLRVQLARPLRPGERTDVSVSWTLELARVEHRTGIAERAVNLGNFYPVLCVLEGGEFYECEYYADGDPFYSACADYFLSFRADADYTLAASGRILSAEEEGTKKTYTLELYGARDLALVLSKEFSVAQGEACGAQVMYYYYDDPAPARSLALAEESLTYFSEMFGSYPYPVFSAPEFIWPYEEKPHFLDPCLKMPFGGAKCHPLALFFFDIFYKSRKVVVPFK